MKTFITTAGLCLALVAAGSVSSADEHELMPIPAAPGTIYSAPPSTAYAPGVMDDQMYDVPVADHIMYDAAPAPLYTNVKYRDAREKAPCAVTKIIRVKDPCDCGDGCCGQRYVFIQICVPPCACETIKCRRDGDRVRYDYGKYAVDVRIKRNHIVVDYQK